MNKDQVLASLPSLSQPDLKAIQAVIGSLLCEGGSNATPTLTGARAWLFEALQATLNAKFSYSQFERTKAGKDYALVAPVVLDYIAASFPSYEGRIKVTALMRWLLFLLAQNMKDMNMPLLPTTLVNEMHYLPVVFEKSYPGYAKAGLAELVADKAIKRRAA